MAGFPYPPVGRCRSLARVLAVTALAALAVPGLASPARAAPASGGHLTVTQLSFAQSSVDATSGTATATVTWTVQDSDASATAVSGDVDIRLEGPKPGTFTGQTFDIGFGFPGGTLVNGSGTAQDSTYSYAFRVPQYAFAATAHWAVTRLTAQDNQGAHLTLGTTAVSSFGAVLTATELADSTAPTFDSLAIGDGLFNLGPPDAYNGGTTTGSMLYSFVGDDAQAGFWKARLTLAGPGGRTVRGTVTFSPDLAQGVGTCGASGNNTVFDDTTAPCVLTESFPPGTPAGTWTVTAMTVWDNAGNHATFRKLNELPIALTADAVDSASGFTATPDPVNNWAASQIVQLSMAVAGARDGVASIVVDFGPDSFCAQQSTTPVQAADGTWSVPVVMPEGTAQCTVTGIAITDGAGNAALYGTEFGAPDPGVALTRLPDTSPPVATAASVSPATFSISSLPPGDSFRAGLTITASAAIAPVSQFSITVLNSSGQPVGGESGGVSLPTLNETFTEGFTFSATTPGTYTVAFQITDAGGLTTSYGFPNSPPVPGGPLVLTVTP